MYAIQLGLIGREMEKRVMGCGKQLTTAHPALEVAFVFHLGQTVDFIHRICHHQILSNVAHIPSSNLGQDRQLSIPERPNLDCLSICLLRPFSQGSAILENGFRGCTDQVQVRVVHWSVILVMLLLT